MRRPSISHAQMRLATATVASALVLLAVAAPVGAAGSPTPVRDINPTGDSNPTELTQVGNTLFFAADDGVHGVELWKSDGTAAGTKMVKNIRPYGRSSSPRSLVNVNGMLFFTADDGRHGRELWKSDGTRGGTVMVTDMGLGDSQAEMAVGSRLFFFKLNCCIGSLTLYVSDGTAVGTHVLMGDDSDLYLPESSSDLAVMGGKLYFTSSQREYARPPFTLWESDGTSAGTHRVAGTPSADGIGSLQVIGQTLYFFVVDEDDFEWVSTRLWKTNGTPAGAQALTAVHELEARDSGSAVLGRRLFFVNGERLWRSNGTPLGTKPIATLEGVWLDWLTRSGPHLFMTVGSHLWTSDGTSKGTHDLGEFGTQSPTQLVNVAGRLCFIEQDEDAGTWELWESDGTAGGTYVVQSFVGPGPWSSDMQISAIGGQLYFSADDGVHGVELWSFTP